MNPQRIVIIGAGLAGATAAVTLRDEGFDGEIQLIGAERQLPYNRPPLSKGYLRGEERLEDQRVNPLGIYAEKSIRLGSERGSPPSTPRRSTWRWKMASGSLMTGCSWQLGGGT